MPRGGHFGLWKPTPKDIFKSRWKRFYKRCYRPRSQLNTPDKPGPHEQPSCHPDGVPSPWRLLYPLPTSTSSGSQRSDRVYKNYKSAVSQFLQPAIFCRDPEAQETILRALDPPRRGGAESGLGRLQCTPDKLDMTLMPPHIKLALDDARLEEKDATKEEDQDNPGVPFYDGYLGAKAPHFFVRRVYSLLEEKELVWDGGLQTYEALARERNKRQEAQAAAAERRAVREGFTALAGGLNVTEQAGGGGGQSPAGLRAGAPAGGAPQSALQRAVVSPQAQAAASKRDAWAQQREAQELKKLRGNFPFIDEQASLIDELSLKEILRLRHKTSSRRHPKWKEIAYERKKSHQSYLRLRQVALDEAKARMGVLRQALADA